MAVSDPLDMLRPGLLEGVSLLLAGPAAHAPLSDAVAGSCATLGAGVARVEPPRPATPDEREAEAEAIVARGREELGRPDALVFDGAGCFAAAAGRDTLVQTLQSAWELTRALANQVFLADEQGGRVILIAPAPGAGGHADATRAGLENLARTLSIEWARFAVNTIALVPGERTAADEVAALVAYLASPAGSYFSGCLLDLRGP